MGMEELQKLEDEYDYTREDQADLEDKIHEELEEMLEDSTKDEIREEIIELDTDEFQDFVEYVLGQI